MSIVGPGSGHTRQFLLWIAHRPRTYAETMEAWRTSCPRLSAWEDAMADDLIRVDAEGISSHGQAVVRLTRKAAILLQEAIDDVQPSNPARPGAALSNRCERPINHSGDDAT